jgi:hypothetical protein
VWQDTCRRVDPQLRHFRIVVDEQLFEYRLNNILPMGHGASLAIVMSSNHWQLRVDPDCRVERISS